MIRDRLLSIQEVAARLSCSEGTVRNMIERSLLVAVPIGAGEDRKHVRIAENELARYLSQQEITRT